MCVWFFFGGYSLYSLNFIFLCVFFRFFPCAFCDFSSSNSGIACSLYTPSPSSWPLPPSKSMCMRFFSLELTFGATRCYAQSHTDRKREIGESVNRITVHCELICLLNHTRLFSIYFFSLNFHLSMQLFYTYLFIFFCARVHSIFFLI